jgi:3-dehydroquinate synthase
VNDRDGSEARAKVDAPFQVGYVHRLRVTRGALRPDNGALAGVLPPRDEGRSLVFIDDGVARAWPDLADRAAAYMKANAAPPGGPVQTVPGGERCKNDPAALERILAAMHDARLCRRSCVLAIGGGAVLDVVGFAAATAHRGVRLVRIPTTTLAQGDSGVGVKNGVNLFGKKNYLGVFAPPWAVVNDVELLETLSDRDWRCGFSEAVKVALVKDAALFERISGSAEAIARRAPAASEPIIADSAGLHLRHITEGGDPFELSRARPLDFGHWAAHKLEQMTDYRLRHGEAVAIGVALDTLYSREGGFLGRAEADAALGCLEALGFALYDEAMQDTATLLEGLEEFREHLGGALTVTLLRGIGRGFDAHEIDPALVRSCVEQLARRGCGRRRKAS